LQSTGVSEQNFIMHYIKNMARTKNVPHNHENLNPPDNQEAESDFRIQFTRFIQTNPKSIFFGTRGGRLYRKHNSVCLSPFINDDFFKKYFSLEPRGQKTSLQDLVYNNIRNDGYNFYTYVETGQGQGNFVLCNSNETREKTHTYIYNRAIAFKKKGLTKQSDEKDEYNLSSIEPNVPIQDKGFTKQSNKKEENNLSKIETNVSKQDNDASSIDSLSIDEEEFKDISVKLKRYVQHVVKKMLKRLLPVDQTESALAKPDSDLFSLVGAQMNDDIVTAQFASFKGNKKNDDDKEKIIKEIDDKEKCVDDLIPLVEAQTKKRKMNDEIYSEDDEDDDDEKLFEFPFYITETALNKNLQVVTNELSFPFYLRNRITSATINKENILNTCINESYVNISFSGKDLKVLEDNCAWLNDNHLSLFLMWSLRFHENDSNQQRYKVFGCPLWLWESLEKNETSRLNSFFHPIYNIFKYDVLIVVIHWTNHWALAAVVNHGHLVDEKRKIQILPEILYFDSLQANDIKINSLQSKIYKFLNSEVKYWYPRRKRAKHVKPYCSSEMKITVVDCK